MIQINTKNLLILILVLATGWYAYDSDIITKVEESPTPTEAPESLNEQAVATAIQNLQNMTPTAGSAGAGQLETAIPTKMIVPDPANAEAMRQILQDKMASDISLDWLVTARLTTGGGAHACFVGWYDKDGNIPSNHPDQPMWELIDQGKILTADELGFGGCKTTIKVGEMMAGIPASYLKDITNYTITEEQKPYEDAAIITTRSRVIVTVKVPYGFLGLNVQPGNEVTLPTVIPNENTAYVVDSWKYLFSLGDNVSGIWVKWAGLDNTTDNLAILDVIAPIQDWRTGARSPEHLEKLREFTLQSVQPGYPTYETITNIVCAAADKAGYQDIPAQLEDGTPATLKKCEVRINLVGPNPTKPEEWYHLDSIPPTWPTTMTDTAGWASYLAALRPVINPDEFTRYNWDNAYVLYQPDLQSGAWWTQVPEQLRLWAP